MVTCKQSAKELAGDEWTLGDLSGLSTEEFWTWAKTDTIGYDGHPYLAMDKCVGSYGSSWESAYGENTKFSTRTT